MLLLTISIMKLLANSHKMVLGAVKLVADAARFESVTHFVEREGTAI